MPLVGAGFEFGVAGLGELVEASAAACGGVPRGRDEFVGFELVEDGVEGARLEIELIGGGGEKAFLYLVAVGWAFCKHGQDHEVDGAA